MIPIHKLILTAVFICVPILTFAGHYSVQYSGGAADIVGPLGTHWTKPYQAWNASWVGGGQSIEPPNQSGNLSTPGLGSVNAHGQITATFTWVRDNVGDNPPQVVLVKQTCGASWSGNSGSCSSGLPNETAVTSEASGSAIGNKASLKSHPGESFTIQCSPNASSVCSDLEVVLCASSAIFYTA
jgi:hypothetical protein